MLGPLLWSRGRGTPEAWNCTFRALLLGFLLLSPLLTKGWLSHALSWGPGAQWGHSCPSCNVVITRGCWALCSGPQDWVLYPTHVTMVPKGQMHTAFLPTISMWEAEVCCPVCAVLTPFPDLSGQGGLCPFYCRGRGLGAGSCPPPPPDALLGPTSSPPTQPLAPCMTLGENVGFLGILRRHPREQGTRKCSEIFTYFFCEFNIFLTKYRPTPGRP